MSLSALYKRLKAVEARPSAQRPLRITGGLPPELDSSDSATRLNRAPQADSLHTTNGCATESIYQDEPAP